MILDIFYFHICELGLFDFYYFDFGYFDFENCYFEVFFLSLCDYDMNMMFFLFEMDYIVLMNLNLIHFLLVNLQNLLINQCNYL